MCVYMVHLSRPQCGSNPLSNSTFQYNYTCNNVLIKMYIHNGTKIETAFGLNTILDSETIYTQCEGLTKSEV